MRCSSINKVVLTGQELIALNKNLERWIRDWVARGMLSLLILDPRMHRIGPGQNIRRRFWIIRLYQYCLPPYFQDSLVLKTGQTMERTSQDGDRVAIISSCVSFACRSSFLAPPRPFYRFTTSGLDLPALRVCSTR